MSVFVVLVSGLSTLFAFAIHILGLSTPSASIVVSAILMVILGLFTFFRFTRSLPYLSALSVSTIYCKS